MRTERYYAVTESELRFVTVSAWVTTLSTSAACILGFMAGWFFARGWPRWSELTVGALLMIGAAAYTAHSEARHLQRIIAKNPGLEVPVVCGTTTIRMTAQLPE